MSEISRKELIKVIKDFIELGHVENIVSMFKQDTSLYRLTGDLINDERFMVRMGVAVLFEELKVLRPDETKLAVPYLLPLLDEKETYIRGEAASLLCTIGSRDAIGAVSPLKNDPDPQIAEIVRDCLKSSKIQPPE